MSSHSKSPSRPRLSEPWSRDTHYHLDTLPARQSPHIVSHLHQTGVKRVMTMGSDRGLLPARARGNKQPQEDLFVHQATIRTSRRTTTTRDSMQAPGALRTCEGARGSGGRPRLRAPTTSPARTNARVSLHRWGSPTNSSRRSSIPAARPAHRRHPGAPHPARPTGRRRSSTASHSPRPRQRNHRAQLLLLVRRNITSPKDKPTPSTPLPPCRTSPCSSGPTPPFSRRRRKPRPPDGQAFRRQTTASFVTDLRGTTSQTIKQIIQRQRPPASSGVQVDGRPLKTSSSRGPRCTRAAKASAP